MSKAFILNFDDSEEELYQWITRTPNAEKIIKKFVNDKINNNKLYIGEKNLDDDLFDADYFRINQNLNGEVSSKDLKAMFDDDSFWD